MSEKPTTICPKCGYVRHPYDKAPDYECPRCGIVYAKYQAAVDAEAKNAPGSPSPRAQESTPSSHRQTLRQYERTACCEDCNGLVSRLAEQCPHCGRPFGAPISRPVHVTDLRMTFAAMVAFMVKWVIAAIPATFILILIVMVAYRVALGLLYN